MSEIRVDTISEKTSANGVAVDGVTIKDGGIAATAASTITTADNTDTLSLISTDADALVGPNLNFYRNSSSPADGDLMGQIKFTGESAGSGIHTYGSIVMENNGVTDGQEQGKIKFNISMPDGALANVFNIDRTEICINEDSEDLDFRVESNGNTHMLFVDGGNNRVGIANAPDLGVGLHIKSADSGAGANADADELVVEGSGHSGISILSATGDSGRICFGDSGDDNIGQIIYQHGSNSLHFDTGGAERMRITSTGQILQGLTSSNVVFYSKGVANNELSFRFSNSSTTTPYGGIIDFDAVGASGADNNTQYFLRCGDTTAIRFFIYSDGDVQNHDNSYGAISDERIKSNITDANSQWNDIKNIKVRNFQRKDDIRDYGADEAKVQLGVIAQELETVSPKLVKEYNPTNNDIMSDSAFGTLYADGDDIPEGKKIGDVKEIKEQVKGVSYSILYMKAIKALQEAMTRIETLETKVAALEG
mgnify:FL=1